MKKWPQPTRRPLTFESDGEDFGLVKVMILLLVVVLTVIGGAVVAKAVWDLVF